MSEIQEQVEDFKKYHLLESDKGAFDDILRSFLEECCKAECQWCAGVGYRENTNQEVCPAQRQDEKYIHILIWDTTQRDESSRTTPCKAAAIRHHFAWLDNRPTVGRR